jgi:type I restriction enzyme, S subunit
VNPEQFLAEFSHIASAPNGIDQIRQLIMGLALSGDLLVPNASLPEDFSSLLEVSKQRYFEKLGKRLKPVLFGEPLIREFKIPNGWKWVRVGEICDLQTGATPNTQHTEYYGGTIRWLVSGDINKIQIFDCVGRITDQGFQNSNCKILPPGSVLIALNGQGKTRASVAILRVPAACNQSLVAMIPFNTGLISPEYLFLALKFRYFEIRDITGQNQRRGLNMGLVSELSIPLPPLAEQQRIVAKVDELMDFCKEFETQQKQRTELCSQLRGSVLHNLINVTSAQALEDAWYKTKDNLELIIDTPEASLELNSAIVGLGLRGFLTERGLGSAESLLKTASEEQARLVERGKLPNLKGLLPITIVPYELPENWRWARLYQVARVVDPNPSHRMPKYIPQGVPFISTENFAQNDEIDFAVGKQVSEEELKDHIARYDIVEGSFVFSRIGTIGKTCRLPIQRNYCISHALAVIAPLTSGINEQYLRIAVSAETTLAQALEGVKSIGVPDLGMAKIRNFLIPIPPLEEQIRIVATIDLLGNLCRTLQSAQTLAFSQANTFALATIAAITGIQIREGEQMKSPKTELVSVLQTGSSPSTKDHAPLSVILAKSSGELSAKALWSTSGLEIEAFYQQLKTEMSKGWIIQPEIAYVREIEAN